MVSAATLSDAWLETLVQVAATPDRKLFHAVTQITNPTAENPAVRAAADGLLSERGDQPIETVANTLFPAQLAAASRDPAHLAARYRAAYPTIKRIHKSNRRGTYFGRLVDYPSAAGSLDQLSSLIRKLNQEFAGDRPKSARYEVPIACGVEDSADLAADEPDDAEVPTTAMPIHAADRDTSPMDFPCLSFCSFQLDHGRLHLVAHYRSQYLVQRGYGNYLGLARLQSYVAALVGPQRGQVEAGQLLVVAGLAHADAPKYRVAALARSVAPAAR
jgi:hypothetical protein